MPVTVAARLLRLWVRFPPWAWMYVCCECCVFQPLGTVRPIYRTGTPLPPKHPLLYIFFQQMSVLNFLNMLHTSRFFPSKCRLFHNATCFGSCIIRVLHTGCAKI
jgi:hypothetical protein